MASISTLVDRVKMFVNSSGTGNFVLGAAVPAFRGAEALIDGATYSYAVENGSNFEAGTGVFAQSARQIVRSPTVSSNGGAAVAFPAGVQLAFVALAQDLIATGGSFPIVNALGSDPAVAIAQEVVSSSLAGKYDASNPDGFVNDAAVLGIAVGAGSTQAPSRAVLLATTGSGIIGFSVAATGAAPRTSLDKLRDSVSVKDFGAIGDNSLHTVAEWIIPGALGRFANLAAVQVQYPAVTATTDSIDWAAFTAAAAFGGPISVPKGAYYFNKTLVLPSQVNFFGDVGSTYIVTNQTTGDVVDITYTTAGLAAPALTIEGLEFTTSVTRVSGAYIHQSGDAYNTYIAKCQFQAGYDAIFYGGTGVGGFYIQNCIIRGPSHAGIIFGASSDNNAGGNGWDLIVENVAIVGFAAGTQVPAGILVYSAGDLTLKHVSTIYCILGFQINPQPNRRAQLVVVENSFFDSGDQWGIYVSGTGNGRINSLTITDCWSGTNGAGGIYLGANIDQCKITSVDASNSLSQQGIRITSGAKNVTINGCTTAGNALDGILVDTGATDFTIIGCRSGSSGEFGGNGGRGITIVAGASDHYIITGNRLYGNTGTNISDGGTGVNKSVANNI